MFPARIFMNSTNLSTNTTPKSTMATQHTPRCQQLGSSSGQALMVMSINIEGMSAAKQQVLAEICQRQKCDVLCVQETHRGETAVRPRIRGMSLVAEIPHEQYGSALFIRNDAVFESFSTHTS